MSSSPLWSFQLPYFLFGWKRRLLGGGPIFVTFFVTSRCEARCAHCFQPFRPGAGNDPLSPDEVARFASTMPRFFNLLVSGGEPFARDDLEALIAPLVESCGVRQVTIPTSGDRPDRIGGAAASIANRFPRAKVNIRVSLDGPPAIHDAIRGTPGGFERAVATAEKIRDAAARRANLWLELCFTLSTRNAGEYTTLLDELDRRGIAETPAVILCRAPTRDPGISEVTVDDYRSAQRRMRERVAASRGRRSPHSRVVQAYLQATENRIVRVLENPSWRWKCSAGRLSLVIDEEGRVYPCETLWREVGDLRASNYDFAEILRGPKLAAFREEIAGGCRCTHETCVTTDASFSPASWPTFAANLIRRAPRDQ